MKETKKKKSLTSVGTVFFLLLFSNKKKSPIWFDLCVVFTFFFFFFCPCWSEPVCFISIFFYQFREPSTLHLFVQFRVTEPDFYFCVMSFTDTCSLYYIYERQPKTNKIKTYIYTFDSPFRRDIYFIFALRRWFFFFFVFRFHSMSTHRLFYDGFAVILNCFFFLLPLYFAILLFYFAFHQKKKKNMNSSNNVSTDRNRPKERKKK